MSVIPLFISGRARLFCALVALPVVSATASAEKDAPSAIDVVQAHIEAFNRHDVDALVMRVSPDFVWYNVTSNETTIEVEGRDALRESLTKYFKSTTSVRSEIDGMTQVGPFVSFRERAFWTNAKGEQSQQSLAIYEVREGLIARAWYYPATK